MTINYEKSFSTTTDYNADGITFTKSTGAITGLFTTPNSNGGTLRSGLKFDLTLLDNTTVVAPSANTGIVYITNSGNSSWGFLMKSDGTITGKWGANPYPNNNNPGAEYLVTQDELKALAGDSDSVTLWVKINAGSGTHMYSSEAMDDASKLYSNSGLHSTGNSITSLTINSTYIERVYYNVDAEKYYNVDAGTDVAKATFTNADGNWSMSWDYNDHNIDAVSFLYEVNGTDSATIPDATKQIIAGGTNGLQITSTAETPVSIGNTIFLASSSASTGSAISINNAGAVNMSGNLYLVENASIASTGTGNITISGAVTDKNVPTGAEGTNANGAYTLSLSGTRYNFTGEVDVHGLHIAEGSEATFSNKLTIGSTITGSGTLTLGGELVITDAWAMNDATYTYADGATSGYRAGYSATIFNGNLTVQPGTNVTLTLQEATATGSSSWNNGTVHVDITSTVYDVNEALTYSEDTMGEDTMGEDTRIQVNSAGTLTFTAGLTSTATVTNHGTVVLQQGANNVDVNSLLGVYDQIDITTTGSIVIETTGNTTITDALNIQGAGLVIKGGTFSNTTATNTSHKIEGSKLVLNGVTSATISGSKKLSTNLELINTSLTLNYGDVIDHENTGDLLIKVGSGSSIELGTNRQSLRNNHVIEMAGGRISGTGNTSENCLLGLDFYSGGRINTTADSTIATNVGGHLTNGSVVFDVSNGVTLTMTGTLQSNGTYEKSNAGTMLYKGEVFTRDLQISGGVFEYYTDTTVTHTGTISGAGEFKKSGSGTLTLNSAKTSVSTLNVIAGTLQYNSTSDTSHTLKGNSGSIFEKTGSGALTVNTGNFAGEILVSEGTLKNAAKMDKNQKVTVAKGGILDLNGWLAYYNLTLLEGAILTNNRTETDSQTSTNKAQLHTITLQGNAIVQGSYELGMVGSNHSTTRLYLGGHTLTKNGGNTFHLVNTTVESAGIIEVNGGKVWAQANNSGTLDLTRASLKINGGSFELSNKSQNIQDLTLTGGTLTINSGFTLTAQGNVEVSGGTVSGNLCITSTINQTGGTLNLASAVLSASDLSRLDYTLSDMSTSGLVETTYHLISGDEVNATFSQTQVSVGGTEYALNTDSEGNVLASFNLTEGMYYVAADDIITAGGNSADENTAKALRYTVDGTLNIAGDVSVQNILAKNGQVNVQEAATLRLAQGLSSINKLNAANATVSLGQDVCLILGNDKTSTTHNIGTLSTGENSTINLAEKATLESITLATGKTVTLTGSGSYNLGNSNSSMTSGVNLGSTWTGTLIYSYQNKGNDLIATLTTLANLSSTDKLQVSGAAGYVADVTNSHTNELSADIILENNGVTPALILCNGNSNKTGKFTGAISGMGDVVFNPNFYSSNPWSWENVTYEFSGNVKGWTGNIITKNTQTGDNKILTIVFSGNATYISANLVNNDVADEKLGISANTNDKFNLKIDNTKDVILCGTVDVDTLTISNTGKTTFNGKVTADTLSAEGNSVTLGGGTAEDQMLHSIGSFNGTVSNLKLGAYTTLSFAKGTVTSQKVNTVGSLTTSTGASISLGDYATLKITDVPAALASEYKNSNNEDVGNNDASSSVSLAITGGIGSVLDLAMDSSDGWQKNNTVTLAQGENSGLTVRISSGYLANSVFAANNNVYTTTNLGGSALSMANGTSLVLRRENKAENFGAGDITLEGTADLRVYGSVSKDNTSLTNNISGNTLKITNGPVVYGNTSDGGITLTGNLNLTKLSNQARKEVVLSGESMQFGTLEVNSSNGSTTTISGNATADSVSVQQGKLSVTADAELNLGDTATITKAEGGNAASMQNVKLNEEGIASADETKATKGSVTDAKVTLAALAEGTSFSIEDVTLSNVNIEAANADDRVNLSGVSATDVQLTKGEFHMLDQAQPQVGMGGSATNLVEGVPSGLQFSTSLLNGMTLGVDASMVVDLGDLSGFTGMDSGKPTFSITLEGFRLSDYTGTGENKRLYFASDSWLGQLLVAQGASQYVKGDTLEAGAQATAGTGSGVSVSYNSTAVGTVIIISGLQVPEPATSTLGLIALSALAMRRRRK